MPHPTMRRRVVSRPRCCARAGRGRAACGFHVGSPRTRSGSHGRRSRAARRHPRSTHSLIAALARSGGAAIAVPQAALSGLRLHRAEALADSRPRPGDPACACARGSDHGARSPRIDPRPVEGRRKRTLLLARARQARRRKRQSHADSPGRRSWRIATTPLDATRRHSAPPGPRQRVALSREDEHRRSHGSGSWCPQNHMAIASCDPARRQAESGKAATSTVPARPLLCRCWGREASWPLRVRHQERSRLA